MHVALEVHNYKNRLEALQVKFDVLEKCLAYI